MNTQLRVTHCPVNFAGLPWTNVEALRRRGVDARLVVFERGKLFPEADLSLDRPRGFLRRQAVQWPALARLLPQTDIFHFYFGLTLVPKSLQFRSSERRARSRSSTFSARTSADTPSRSWRTAAGRMLRSSAPTTHSAGCPRRR